MNTTAEFFAIADSIAAAQDALWAAWFRQQCLAAGIRPPRSTQPRIAGMPDEGHARALAAHLASDPALTVRVIFVVANPDWIVCVEPAAHVVPVRCEGITAALATTTTATATH